MASLTLIQPTKVGSATWRYTYSGTGPFRRYVNGAIVSKPDDVTEGRSDDTYLLVTNNDDNLEPPPVEVYDTTDLTTIPVQFDNASRAILQWRGSQDDELYLVEYWSGAAWTDPDYPRVQSHGLGYYQFPVPFAQDSSVQWRITAQQLDGEQSELVEYEFLMVASPNPPSISGAYSAGSGLLTISAR